VPRATLLIAARNRAKQFSVALPTIRQQAYEDVDILVVDDGSTDDTQNIIQDNLDMLRVHRIERRGGYRRNPGGVWNVGHGMATSEIAIEQGAEVCHLSDCVSPLVSICRPGVVALARVFHGHDADYARALDLAPTGALALNDDYEPSRVFTCGDRWLVPDVRGIPVYCGRERAVPFLFLGAIHQEDFRDIGGYDESIPGRNDEDLANRLLKRGVRFVFSGRAVAFHLAHGKS
jgi:glycosyltransferase involved in cell wall biosynthesis